MFLMYEGNCKSISYDKFLNYLYPHDTGVLKVIGRDMGRKSKIVNVIENH